jgi:hypothetical protein
MDSEESEDLSDVMIVVWGKKAKQLMGFNFCQDGVAQILTKEGLSGLFPKSVPF